MRRVLMFFALVAVLPACWRVCGQDAEEIEPYLNVCISSTAPTFEQAFAGNGSSAIGSDPLSVGVRKVPIPAHDMNFTAICRLFLRFRVENMSSLPTSIVLELTVEEIDSDVTLVAHEWMFQEGGAGVNFVSYDSSVLGEARIQGNRVSLPLLITVEPGASIDLMIRSKDDLQQANREGLVTVETAILRVGYVGIPSVDTGTLFGFCIIVLVFLFFYFFKREIDRSDRTTAWDRLRDKPKWP